MSFIALRVCRETEPGVGLGLARITRHLVRLLGGRVELDSQLGAVDMSQRVRPNE